MPLGSERLCERKEASRGRLGSRCVGENAQRLSQMRPRAEDFWSKSGRDLVVMGRNAATDTGPVAMPGDEA